MKLKIVSVAMVPAALLLGCTTVADKTAQDRPIGLAQPCLQANTKEQTCELNAHGVLVCPVYVFNTPSGTVVFPYKLKVPAGVKAKIVWHLLEPKASFDIVDGPQELKHNDEFTDGGPTSDPEGGSVSANGRRYRFTYKNTKPSQSHPYTIQFRTQTGTFRCDPTITNEAG